MDKLFIRVKDYELPFVTLPLNELFNGIIIPEKLTEEEVVIMDLAGDTTKSSRKSFHKNVEKLLAIGVIESIAIQPIGDDESQEVRKFLETYDKNKSELSSN